MKATYLISAQSQSHNTNAVNLQLKLKEKKKLHWGLAFWKCFHKQGFLGKRSREGKIDHNLHTQVENFSTTPNREN